MASAAIRKHPPVDPKVYALVEHFRAGLKGTTSEDIGELAGLIQEVVCEKRREIKARP